MDPGYTGHRPRLQIIQGDADEKISFKNSAEAIKQWTNVLALSTAPASTDMTKTSIATYTRQFWQNACGYVVFETWAGHGGGHSMGYEEDAILKFFGLDVAAGTDPEPECPPGGAAGAGGAGGASSGGASGTNGGAAGFSASGGAAGSVPSDSGGSPGSAGASSIAGSSAGGLSSAAGAPSTVGSSGSAASGAPSTGPVVGTPPADDGSSDGGCSYVGASKANRSLPPR